MQFKKYTIVNFGKQKSQILEIKIRSALYKYYPLDHFPKIFQTFISILWSDVNCSHTAELSILKVHSVSTS